MEQHVETDSEAIVRTRQVTEHEVGYDGPCACAECRGNGDGESDD